MPLAEETILISSKAGYSRSRLVGKGVGENSVSDNLFDASIILRTIASHCRRTESRDMYRYLHVCKERYFYTIEKCNLATQLTLDTRTESTTSSSAAVRHDLGTH
jgi:hypothetical protein